MLLLECCVATWADDLPFEKTLIALGVWLKFIVAELKLIIDNMHV